MDWYKNWFGRDYFMMYAYRDSVEARSQIDFILRRFNPKSVLDIACGNGRHVEELLRKKVPVVGVDLSEVAVKDGAARLQNELLPKSLAVADMRRLPFGNASFDLLLSMFNSFGYFDSDAEHQALLEEWHRVLLPTGSLFLDYLNVAHVKSHLVPVSNTVRGSKRIVQKRSLREDRVIKEITIINATTGDVREYHESVRLYPCEQLETLLGEAGFLTSERFGSFQGEPFSEHSPQLIIIAKRQGN